MFILAFIPVYFYLGFRLADHWSHWMIIAVFFCVILSFPYKKIFRHQLYFIYGSMGLLTYLTLFTVLRDGVWLLTGDLYSKLYVLIFTVLCLVIGFVNARRGPRIRRLTVPISDLPEGLIGFKLTQISDLHVGPTINKAYVDKVVRKVNTLDSDLICLTGDIGDGPVKIYEADAAPLALMKARFGSYFTPGNHEYYWDVNEWLRVMKTLGIINLVNRGHVVRCMNSSLLIAGIPDPVGRISPDFKTILKGNENVDLKILLSHRPGIAEEAALVGFHLQLSGHTHGGQFFPWTLVVKLVHKYSKGLHRLKEMWIYVNPGTGSWGPLLRLGTTPEITLLTLTQSKSERKNSSER
jgi:predicted MPP superfamily phosphohydrolase